MDEHAPSSESEFQPLCQMARVDCTDKLLTGGALPNGNQQKEILVPVGNLTSCTDNNPPEQGVSHLFFITVTVLRLLFLLHFQHPFSTNHQKWDIGWSLSLLLFFSFDGAIIIGEGSHDAIIIGQGLCDAIVNGEGTHNAIIVGEVLGSGAIIDGEGLHDGAIIIGEGSCNGENVDGGENCLLVMLHLIWDCFACLVMASQWSLKLLEIVNFWLANAVHFLTFSKNFFRPCRQMRMPKACCLWTPAPPILSYLPFQFSHSPTETEEAEIREESIVWHMIKRCNYQSLKCKFFNWPTIHITFLWVIAKIYLIHLKVACL